MAAQIRTLLGSKSAKALAAVALVALGLWCIFDSRQFADLTFYTAINDRAMELIDDTLVRDQATFLVITAIKTSLAMIEGSTVGVGFEFQIGDVVQPAYDYVDFFWRAFLYAFMILGFYKLLLETELLLLGISLMGVGFVFLGLSLAGKIPQLDLRLWGRRCLLIGILFAYLAPLSLLMTDVLSDRYTATIKDKHFETIKAFNEELEAASLEFVQLKDEVSILQPSRSLDRITDGMMRVVNRVSETFRLSLFAFLYYVLVILFELLFFPLLSAVFLYKFTLFALDRLLQKPQADAPAPTAPSEARQAA